MSAKPFTFEAVLTGELEEIEQSRKRRVPEIKPAPPEDPSQADPYKKAHDAQLLGVAFSGGGIRSATFNLGILQALADMDILRWVDYLSTVSGGGYIGSWLAAWIKRQPGGTAGSPVQEVQSQLDPAQGARPSAEPLNPIHFLRQFSNYLTPRVGFFGADTWTMIAIYLRNVILNQVILISTIALVLLVPRFAGWPFQNGTNPAWPEWVSLLALTIAMVFVGWNLLRLEANGGHRKLPFYAAQGGIQIMVAAPVLVAAYFSSLALWRYTNTLDAPFRGPLEFLQRWSLTAGTFTALLLVAGFAGIFRRSVKLRKVPAAFGLVLLSAAVPGVLGGFMLWGVAALFHVFKPGDGGAWHALAWGPPMLMAVFSLAAILHLGLMGLAFPDSGREWWSRLGAWLGIYMLSWAALVTVTIYGPLILALSAKALAGISFAWIATTVGGLMAGRNSETGPRSIASSSVVRMLAESAPYVFIAGLLVAIATGLQLLLPCLDAHAAGCAAQGALFANWSNLGEIPIMLEHFQIMNGIPLASVAWSFAALAAIAVVLAWRVDINEFSMHHFYRNRLVRCYLGASHRREPQAFTGFDAHDDLKLADLAGPGFTGPYPLVNTTLNLVRGDNLAWQQRKGASFIFTPKFCGYQVACRPEAGGDARPSHLAEDAIWPGYRETRHYAYPELGGVSLGTAMAISGAAASPNEGYHSSPATAFLMTVFDVRLGWWLGNPATAKYRQSAPKFALFQLMRELFGLTDQQSQFVYLSDGGHFENLGIYELVRRRCRYIIACDADQDGDLGFGDLGNAIRKCRTDMGVEIEIDIDAIRRQANGMSNWHCGVGTIHYETLGEGAAPGTLVYIKSSLTGDEAADVMSYRTEEPAFPHQSTADQWFDEAQFESYRKLGYHVGHTTFEAADANQPMRNGVETFFVALRQAWYPASTAAAASISKHASALDQMFERLRKDPDLAFLDAQIYPEWQRLNAQAAGPAPTQLWLPTQPAELRAGFYFCNSLIQLMESVYLDLRLAQEHDHPDNRGWMNLFKHWAWSGMFRATWAICVSTYGARFQTFCSAYLGIESGAVRLESKGLSAPELNFHERDLITELGRIYPEVTRRGSVLLFQLAVSDLSAGPVPAAASSALRFTFGFAVVFDNEFVMFRIQDHLRKMGLGRQALRLLKDKHQFNRVPLQTLYRSPRGSLETEITEELRSMGSPENICRFEQLLRSVQREPRTPVIGAHA
jgi:hypothetical protein